jgi:hypothetical protein
MMEVHMSKEKKQKKKNKHSKLIFKSVRSVPTHSTDLSEEQIGALFDVMHHPDAPTRKLVEARQKAH